MEKPKSKIDGFFSSFRKTYPETAFKLFEIESSFQKDTEIEGLIQWINFCYENNVALTNFFELVRLFQDDSLCSALEQTEELLLSECKPDFFSSILESLESILPNFHFFGFPIFAVKLESL